MFCKIRIIKLFKSWRLTKGRASSLFGCKSWVITITGILIDLDNHVYPSEKMRQLREMFEINDTFEVLDCRLLEDLGIQSIYFDKIEDFGLGDKSISDTIKYKITANSIKPLEFFV